MVGWVAVPNQGGGGVDCRKTTARRRFDFAQEEKGAAHEYEKAEEILTRAIRVHRALLPRIEFQIENLINLHELPPRVRLVALPVKWKSESAPARVIAFLDE